MATTRRLRRPDVPTELIVRLYRMGRTIQQIATDTGMSKAGIHKRMLRAREPRAAWGKTKPYDGYVARVRRKRVRERRWKLRNIERMRRVARAGYHVRRAIARGELIRPLICENCDIPGKNGERPQAAHFSYDRPLDVRWLCRNCHGIWDHDHPKSKL